MGIFGRRKSAEPKPHSNHPEYHLKEDISNVRVLNAVNEAQPYEVNSGHSEGTLSPDMVSRDLTGKPIANPDHTNPTRARDERPLATIRGFEYCATGDPSYLDQMQREGYNWHDRRYTQESDFDWKTRNYRVHHAAQYDEYGRPIESDPYSYQYGNNRTVVPPREPERKIISLGNSGASNSYATDDTAIKLNESKGKEKKKKKKLFGKS
ncbi:hypothetical protein CANCADRAFT_93472 [Tortispora caseinolytica NRRL Y-17796]|uniref:Uncharacterized protein n=1 Tax=Tortispora caseinolytica NRRL Y-17796 TaxID=767744 RepID=A0A1E4TM05_9ASCO|nr:hypothetical protein CANCADRAFT_93472 [Tortispora caseinolytica NRRL Y-17796]